jgi:hypothetical protein
MTAVDDVHIVQAEAAHHSFAAEAVGRMAVGAREDIGLRAAEAVGDNRLAAAGTVVGIDPEADNAPEGGTVPAEGIDLEDVGLGEGIARSLGAGEALKTCQLVASDIVWCAV